MTINLLASPHPNQLMQIEWEVLTKIISQFAFFDFNKAEFFNSSFYGRIDGLSIELEKIKSYQNTFTIDHIQLLRQLFSNLPADESLDKFINYLSKEGVLNLSELNKITKLVEASIFINREFSPLQIEEITSLKKMDFNSIQRKFIKEFRYLVDPTGEVHYDKHPELSDLYRRLRDIEDRLRKSIQDWINQPANTKILQYVSYDVHFDRFVVPVRSDSYRSEIGLIVSRSESGHTLFVEPFEIREYCNRRQELMAKIDEIINQINLRFSRQLAEFSPNLNLLLSLFRRIDYFLAKSEFSERYSLEMPIIRSCPGFKLTQVFHPLIKNPVKNDVHCSDDVHGIVISGPNTGGKTVFLKSITLSYLLFYHGFFVPAKEAELFPYEGLFYFGNDLQDLNVGLSSFSGEVKNYIQLINQLTPSNLILIDEIFNSTSSDEASALSLAYFDELHKRSKCQIVVSTHHQMFKTLVHQDHHYLSCHVGFDTVLFKPTYKILWGTPGASMAVDIFKIIAKDRNDLNEIPLRAVQLLSEKNISYETLLQKVTQKEIELDKLIEQNRKTETDLKNQKGAMEGILNLKMNEEINKAKKEIDKILNNARQILDESQKNPHFKTKKIDEKSFELKRDLNKIHEHPTKENLQPPNGSLNILDLSIGDNVYSLVLNKEFIVTSLDARKNEVTIGKGPIKFTVPISTLSRGTKIKKQTDVRVSFNKISHSHVEYDVRGMRLSEFQTLVDRALGDLLSGDIPFLTIIHGHGDGILKSWLRGFLKKSHEFTMEQSETGNDGETKITLK